MGVIVYKRKRVKYVFPKYQDYNKWLEKTRQTVIRMISHALCYQWRQITFEKGQTSISLYNILWEIEGDSYKHC